MKKRTLSQELLEYLAKKNVWVNGGELEEFATTKKFKGSNCARVLRALSEGENPEINKDTDRDKKHTVWYHTKKPMKPYCFKDENGEPLRDNEGNIRIFYE